MSEVVKFVNRIDVGAGLHFEDGLDQPVFQSIHPSVQVGSLLVGPGFLDDAGLGQVHDLFSNIEFDQSVEAFFLDLDRIDLRSVKPMYILDVPKPFVDDPKIVLGHGRHHPATAIVSAYDYMLDLQLIHGIFQYGQQIQIGMHHHIRHVAVHKNLSGLRAGDLIGGYPAIAAPDPKKFGCLQMRKPIEKIRILRDLAGSPDPILLEQFFV